MRDPNGEPLKDPKTSERVVREAHARWLVDRDKADREVQRAWEAEEKAAASVTVLQACQSYLANAKATGAAKTHNDRADTLFDFCFGLPPEFRSKDDKKTEALTAARKKAMSAKRIHEGYGKLPVVNLLPFHVDQWINAHPTWNGSRWSRVQAVKRALNYATEAGLISANPIRGYRTPKSTSRLDPHPKPVPVTVLGIGVSSSGVRWPRLLWGRTWL